MKLNNLKVQELNAQELREVEGGVLPFIVKAAIIAAALLIPAKAY